MYPQLFAERKQKKVNEEVRAPPAPGPAERRQLQLRALLADKQRELEALLNKEVNTVPLYLSVCWSVLIKHFVKKVVSV